MRQTSTCLAFLSVLWILCHNGSVQVQCDGQTPITKVHLLFMNHLDVGYYDGSDNDVGFISEVLNRYFVEYFPRAISLAAQLRNGGYVEKFIYTTQPWLVSLYLNCPNITLLKTPLKCPSLEDQNIFRSAVNNGTIVWHAGPMNMQTDNMGSHLFHSSLTISQNLDAEFGIKRTHATYSQRDVPGLTKAVIGPLLSFGVKAISVGVNPGTAPPDVPTPFVWKSNKTAVDGIMGFWIKGGYPLNPGPNPKQPGGLARDKCIMADNLDEALCFSFRTDNTGPPMSIQEILMSYEIVKSEFSNARIVASTFDNFVQALETVKSTLPVVTSEMGDTWIQGISSDPKKTAMYRAFSREFEYCYFAGKCDFKDPRIMSMMRFLIKIPEHTWGAHNFLESKSWSNVDLAKARKTKNFTDTENTWKEQRQFIDFAFDSLEDHPLKDNVTKAFNGLLAVKPDLTGYFPVHLQNSFKCSDGTIMQVSLSGGLSRLYDPHNGVEWAGPDNLLGQLTYDTYIEQDFIDMAKQYNYNAGVGFDKPNVTKNGSPEKKQWPLSVIYAYQKNDSACDIYLAVSPLDIQTHGKYGAPTVFYVHYVANPTLPGIDVSVLLMDKATTRLPESISFDFKPKPMKMVDFTLDKMAQTIDPCNVLLNGSQYIHGVETGVKFSMKGSTNKGLQILSPDVPLIFIGTENRQPSPFPVPLQRLNCSSINRVSFNFYNNIWNTNYIAWYPYVAADVDFKAQFQIKFNNLN